MTSYAFVERAREWSTSLEDREVFKGNADNIREARLIVARAVGEAPGTLENLRKGRLKKVGAHLYERLRARVIRELQIEVRNLEAEIQVLNAIGTHPASDEMAEAKAGLKAVREALGLSDGGGA